ncbi:hypothetical protein RUND412_007034, partial [Rhizina undulata]
LFYGSVLPYYVAVFAIKATFLSLYFRLIPAGIGAMRVVLYGVTFYTTSAFCICMGLNGLWCIPVNQNWALPSEVQGAGCYVWQSLPIFYASFGLHITADLIIFFLPFFILSCLHLPLRKLLGLILIFSLGAITIAMAAARVITILLVNDVTSYAIWTSMEVNVGLIVACLPSIKPLLRDTTPESTGQLQKTSAISLANAKNTNLSVPGRSRALKAEFLKMGSRESLTRSTELELEELKNYAEREQREQGESSGGSSNGRDEEQGIGGPFARMEE